LTQLAAGLRCFCGATPWSPCASPRCAASRESLPSGTQSRIVPTTAIPVGKPMARLTINGKTLEVNVNPSTPLLWAIREQVGLTGTKYGCGIAQCGACTVHLDGAAVRSCVMPVAAAEGKRITTIEGLASGGALHKVQKARLGKEVPQGGYRQSGMMLAVGAVRGELCRLAGRPAGCHRVGRHPSG